MIRHAIHMVTPFFQWTIANAYESLINSITDSLRTSAWTTLRYLINDLSWFTLYFSSLVFLRQMKFILKISSCTELNVTLFISFLWVEFSVFTQDYV
jgi:hypothetical protein